MSEKQTRFSFAKNNMATAADMQKNEFGQTVLGPKGEGDQPSPYTEVVADPLHGIVAKPRSIIDSPEIQEFLSKHIGGQQAAAQAEPEPPAPPVLDLGDEAELDEFARSVMDGQPEFTVAAPRQVTAEREPQQAPNLRRFSATIQSTLHMAKFCHECGLTFGTTEKFCPHCGTKRTSYEAPRPT